MRHSLNENTDVGKAEPFRKGSGQAAKGILAARSLMRVFICFEGTPGSIPACFDAFTCPGASWPLPCFSRPCLRSNAIDIRIRREGEGQMLDYAANAVAHWPVAHIRERFVANCESIGVDQEERLRDFRLCCLESKWVRYSAFTESLQKRHSIILFDVLAFEDFFYFGLLWAWYSHYEELP